ncbi:hypothetical protein CDQ92_13235 [Sphingopyxis bauzanensis]|uniref:Helix-turn-helix domain-containing protein n=1 Tax=Sphingopyxis bauzanensis TaxID=651663 RepID=A0A246JRU9_9SPHN|nr:helix-turn-helix domain-containing protein [Sphingopyxis bauzanensis]OWQ95740.1 hypothetical protein CDQ92_13235 [Sphingopyxis bauzanensis]GGJ39636.1 hypothetical protein GCM10011393_07350 [Sphingopyxis bauzanensis]
MSSEALAWAFKVNVKPSAVKFTLIALCECANYKTGKIFPSIEHLSEITGQDRKTIIANVAKLEAMGLIRDTGERGGRTKQIKVYEAAVGSGPRIVGDSHYVYRLRADDGSYYIGVRSCSGAPESDGYMGSGSWPKHCAYHSIPLTKEIVSSHESRTAADIAEAMLIKDCIGDSRCMNIEYKDTEKGIPNTGLLKGTVSPPKQSQKRDTEPSREPSSPVSANADTSPPSIKPKDVLDAWNDMAAKNGLPIAKVLTTPRQKRLRTMIAQHPPDDFATALDAVERSPFCRGEKSDWKADFDFFLQTKSFTKLLEGAYG